MLNSESELRKEINCVRQELQEILKNKDVGENEVIGMSEKLDDLIVLYYKMNYYSAE